MKSDQLKAIIASYWRYVRQCPVVAMEVAATECGDERADILVINRDRLLIETEVKVTLGDLRRDVKKNKHGRFRRNNTDRFQPVAYFYFAVPRAIANDAKAICEELYPYAGVLGSNGSNDLEVAVYRQGKLLAGKKLTFPQIFHVVRGQSGTVCRMATKVFEVNQICASLEKQIKELKDWKRLYEGGPGK